MKFTWIFHVLTSIFWQLYCTFFYFFNNALLPKQMRIKIHSNINTFFPQKRYILHVLKFFSKPFSNGLVAHYPCSQSHFACYSACLICSWNNNQHSNTSTYFFFKKSVFFVRVNMNATFSIAVFTHLYPLVSKVLNIYMM